MAVAYWRCCGRIWAGPKHLCPRCKKFPTRIANAAGKPTEAGRQALDDVVASTIQMEATAEEIDRGRRRQSVSGPAMKHRRCPKCKRYRIGDLPGRQRSSRAMLWASVPQDFVPIGTEVCTCVRNPVPEMGDPKPKRKRRRRRRELPPFPRLDNIPQPAKKPYVPFLWLIQRDLERLTFELRVRGFRQ